MPLVYFVLRHRLSLSFSLPPSHHEVKALLHHVFFTMLFGFPIGPKQMGPKQQWTDTSETLTQNKPFLLKLLIKVLWTFQNKCLYGYMHPFLLSTCLEWYDHYLWYMNLAGLRNIWQISKDQFWVCLWNVSRDDWCRAAKWEGRSILAVGGINQ